MVHYDTHAYCLGTHFDTDCVNVLCIRYMRMSLKMFIMEIATGSAPRKKEQQCQRWFRTKWIAGSSANYHGYKS